MAEQKQRCWFRFDAGPRIGLGHASRCQALAQVLQRGAWTVRMVQRGAAGQTDALLLDRHGALTVGRTVSEALARMEMLDAVARIVLLAGGLKAMKPLTPDEADRIEAAALKAGAHEGAVRRWRQAVAG